VHLEREAETRGRVISSLAYPAALAVFGGMSILVILFFVVPRFAELLFDAGAQVPTTTAILVGVSALLREHWISVVSISVVSALLGFRFLRSSRGREISFRVALALPLVGSLQRELLAARFARLSSVLIQGGASLLSALDGSARGMDNRASEAQLARVRARVREGERLNRALAGSGIFPDLLVRLVAVGEESGRIGEFLEKAAQIFEERVQRSVQRVVVLLEPALIVFFGGLVAVVALALLQAIYGVNAGVFR
jgi:type II secretory pathway component PulF